MAVILNSDKLANVGKIQQCHRRVRHGRKFWGAVVIGSQYSVSSIVISISGFGDRYLDFRQSINVSNVGKCRQYHIQVGHGRKYGVETVIAAPSLAVQKLFPLPT